MDIDRIVKVQERGGRLIDKLFEPGRPVIVVFHEDPHDRRLSCLNRGELERACLATLWGRFHEGYYDHDHDPEPARPPLPKCDVDALPALRRIRHGETKRDAIEEWERYEAALSWHRKSAELLETVRAALQGRDGALAFAVLRACSSGEYEGFEAEPSEAIDNLPKVDLLSISRLDAR